MYPRYGCNADFPRLNCIIAAWKTKFTLLRRQFHQTLYNDKAMRVHIIHRIRCTHIGGDDYNLISTSASVLIL